MTASRRLAAGAVVLLTLGLGAAAVSLASPAGAAASDYVKYYTVTSSSDTLAAIAQRLLGSSSRSSEIYAANAGRTQPDGAALGSPTAGLHVGWHLVLPWDAAGSGVNYGLLPTAAPAAPKAPAPTRSAAPVRPRPPVAVRPAAPAHPASRPAAAPKHRPKPKPKATPVRSRPGSPCQAAPRGAGSAADWATLRLAPDQAWVRSRGAGQSVAIVDSGADGTLPQLARHTRPGADVVGGTGRGDADCLGSGTAMAGIVAAQAVAGSPLTGVAPDATVLPIRVATTTRDVRPDDVATGVRMAVSAGASVIVLGAYADPDDPTVARALAEATGRGALVVVPATTGTGGSDGTVGPAPGMLRVGAIGIDGTMLARYRPSGVELVAPGRDVAVLGITGVGLLPVSGAQYAAAFVGGTAALVRAAYPELTAAQVARRLEDTAERMPGQTHGDQYGWGMVNPRSAVETALAEETPAGDQAAVASARQQRRQLPALLVIVGLGAVITGLLALRVRRLVLRRDSGPGGSGPELPSVPPPAAARPAAGPPWAHTGERPAEPPDGPDPPAPPIGAGAGSEWSRQASGGGMAYWRQS